MGISSEGYEEQFRALLISIEASHTDVGKSASKEDNELKRLECTINYHSKEGTASRQKGKERAVFSSS